LKGERKENYFPFSDALRVAAVKRLRAPYIENKFKRDCLKRRTKEGIRPPEHALNVSNDPSRSKVVPKSPAQMAAQNALNGCRY